MKLRKFYFLYLTFLILSSCGIIEMINGYDYYVNTNQFGRKELKTKKFKAKFSEEMNKNLSFNQIYYNYYENNSIKYKDHQYLRLFPTGQFIYFSDTTKVKDLKNINRPSYVGYYIVKDNILELETPSGNFNTGSYRVIWKYNITKNGLEKTNEKSNYPEKFILHEILDSDLKIKPNW